MTERENGQDTSTGKGKVSFTPEQQEEINRIVGREKKEAAEKAKADALKQFEGIDESWMGFVQRYRRDPREATMALMDHVGIKAGKSAQQESHDDDEEYEDETPREKKLREMVERQSREIGELKGLVGNVFIERSEQKIAETYGKDGTLTQEELQTAMKKAKQYKAQRPGLSMEEAFEITNRETVMAGLKRKFAKESSGDEEDDDGGTSLPPKESEDTDLPPVKLGSEPRAGKKKRRAGESVPEALAATIGPGGLFESEEDYQKWGKEPAEPER